MRPRYKTLMLYGAVAGLSTTAGVFAALMLANAKKPLLADPAQIGVPDHRPHFTLADLEGEQRSISDWDGKVILLNFWATWCPPCRKEMPAFVELREELRGAPFEVIGVALDRADPVQDFIDEIGVEYPILLAELDGIQIMREYGNNLTTLPYTVVIDQNGNIVKAFRTEVTRAQAREVIAPLLAGR